MERKKKAKEVLEKATRLIGIGGTGHAVGCTHFAIVTLNYLTGYQRRKAALLEWNRSDDFEKLEIVCTGKSRERKPFRILEADFYKAAGRIELAQALKGNYDDILIDFGVLDEQNLADFLRCEKQFVIGSFSEWQEGAFREFVKRNEAGKKSWNWLAVFGSEESRNEFMRRPGISVARIPSSVDAFSVTKEWSQFLKKLD